MDSTSTLYKTIRSTATAFVNSYSKARDTHDVTHLSSELTPDCRRFVGPPSLLENLPNLAKGFLPQEYEQWMAPEIEAFSTVQVEIKHIIVDEPQRRAVVNSVHHCTAEPGTRTWTFEFMFLLCMTEDGRKICRIEAMTDSGMADRFVAAMKGEMPHLDQRRS